MLPALALEAKTPQPTGPVKGSDLSEFTSPLTGGGWVTQWGTDKAGL